MEIDLLIPGIIRLTLNLCSKFLVLFPVLLIGFACDRNEGNPGSAARAEIVPEETPTGIGSKPGDRDNGNSPTNLFSQYCNDQGMLLENVELAYDEPIQGVIKQQCVSCHNSELKRGGLDLSDANLRTVLSDSNVKSVILDQIAASILSESMPPAWNFHHPELEASEKKCQQEMIVSWVALGGPISKGVVASTSVDEGDIVNNQSEPGANIGSGGQFTYLNTVKGIIDDYCISCHSDALTLGNFNLAQYLDEDEHWNNVLEKLEANTMPPSTSYPDLDRKPLIESIKKWIDAGRPYGDHANKLSLRVLKPLQDTTVSDQFIVSGLCSYGKKVEIGLAESKKEFLCNGTFSFLISENTTGKKDYILKMEGVEDVSLSVHVEEQPELVGSFLNQQMTDQCEANPETKTEKKLKRLSKTQYVESIKNLIPEQDVANLMEALATVIPLVPDQASVDTLTTYVRYSKFDQSLTDAHLTGYHRVADSLVAQLTSDQTDLDAKKRFFGACYNGDSTTLQCVEDFISSFGFIAWRRPLTSGEKTQISTLVQEYTKIENKLGIAVYYILMSPEFLFHLKVEGSNGETWYNLTKYETLSEIAFLMTGAPPTKALLDMVANNELNDEGWENIVLNHLITNHMDQIEANYKKFYKEWLGIHAINFDNSEALAKLLGPSIDTTAKRQVLATDIVEEFLTLLLRQFFTEGRSFSDLLTTKSFYGTSMEYASLYNTTPWDKSGNPPAVEARNGILTNPALLTTGASKTNAFDRGGRIYKHVLCREFPANAAPPADLGQVGDSSTVQSTRMVFESLTPENSSCFGSCHQFINPYGFAFEGFNAIGMPRGGLERFFDSTGAEGDSLSVNTHVEVQFNSEFYAIAGHHELIEKLESSKESHLCFSKQMFRFAFVQEESLQDSCAVRELFVASQTGSLLEVFRTLIKSDAFQRRRISR